MTKREKSRRKDFEDRIDRLSREVEACSKTVEAELSDLTCAKGGLRGVATELARIKEMLAEELTEKKLEAIGDAVEILEEGLAAKRKEVEERSTGKEEEYVTQLKYLKADFENYKRRADKEKCEFGDYLRGGFVLDLLPIKDALEVAIGHAQENSNAEGLVKGVEMTVKQLNKLLKREGLEEIAAEGKQFDPFRHEVVAKESAKNRPENTVIEVLRKGYLLRGKVIRPAMVKIAVKGDTDAT
ncbi:MAG: nucleotide exchange factor GrpE [Methanomicrobia archaeon]|nr:nucleotide exchange factor GrpE [Methanomicrobia archaeon]